MRKSKKPQDVAKKVHSISFEKHPKGSLEISFEHPQYNGLVFRLSIRKRHIEGFGWAVKKGDKEGECMTNRKKTYANKWLNLYKEEIVEHIREREETRFEMLLLES